MQVHKRHLQKVKIQLQILNGIRLLLTGQNQKIKCTYTQMSSIIGDIASYLNTESTQINDNLNYLKAHILFLNLL